MSKLPMPFEKFTTYPDHSGVDFPEPNWSNICASGDGVVTFSGWWNDGAGYSVIVQYTNGPKVLYCHQHKNAIRPSVNQKVSLLSNLGAVGNTGHSTGPHLHMEIMSGKGAHTYEGIWNYFDPDNWIGKVKPIGEDTGMIILIATSASKDGLIRKGWSLADSLTGPITVLSASEQEALDFWAKKDFPYRRAEWPGDKIRELVSVRGLHPLLTDSGRSDYTKVVY